MARTNRRAVTRLLSHALDNSDRGMAQRLAEACGVGASTVTKWRKGETIPNPEAWATVEQVLGLRKGAIAKAASSPITEADLDPTAAEVEALRQEVARLESVVHALIAAKTTEEMIDADPNLDEAGRRRVMAVYLASTGRHPRQADR